MKKNYIISPNILFYASLFLWYFISPGFASEARANQVLAAVAANFYNPFKDITGQFEKKTGYRVQIISGSTGKLYAQIINGAPFELFLAADRRRPELLEQEGIAITGTRFTYAIGKITLWSPNADLISRNGQSILRKINFTHIAMANPITAPYGKAALQTLQKLGLWKEVQSLVVQGENVGQTFQFVSSQNAELGFVALSQVLDPKNHKKGSRWDIPDELYDPLEQDVIILEKGKNNPGARALWNFLRDESAKRIINKYGYGLP